MVRYFKGFTPSPVSGGQSSGASGDERSVGTLRSPSPGTYERWDGTAWQPTSLGGSTGISDWVEDRIEITAANKESALALSATPTDLDTLRVQNETINLDLIRNADYVYQSAGNTVTLQGDGLASATAGDILLITYKA